MILGIYFFRTILKRFAMLTVLLWSHVWENVLPRPVAPLLPGIRMLNTVFSIQNSERNSEFAKFQIRKISDFPRPLVGREKKFRTFFFKILKLSIISYPMSYRTSSNSQNSNLETDLKRGEEKFYFPPLCSSRNSRLTLSRPSLQFWTPVSKQLQTAVTLRRKGVR